LQVAVWVAVLIAAAVQRVVAPCVKVTLPVGSTSVPDAGFTVAVKVVGWFTTGEAGEEESVVAAVALPTVSVMVPAAAAVKFESPL
jgi:hypothetical protein